MRPVTEVMPSVPAGVRTGVLLSRMQLDQGETPSLEALETEFNTSRATAYRYLAALQPGTPTSVVPNGVRLGVLLDRFAARLGRTPSVEEIAAEFNTSAATAIRYRAALTGQYGYSESHAARRRRAELARAFALVTGLAVCDPDPLHRAPIASLMTEFGISATQAAEILPYANDHMEGLAA